MKKTEKRIAHVETWVAQFDQALKSRNISDILSLFVEDCFWRDFVSFTWNIRTLEGHEEISRMLSDNLELIAPRQWSLLETPTHSDGITEAWLRFKPKQHAAARSCGCWMAKHGRC